MKKIFLSLLFVCLVFSGISSSLILTADQGTVKLENPLKVNMDDPAELIGYVIRVFLSVVGGVALVMMVYGGFQWLTAAGNEEKIKSGTQTMFWAAVGLVLVFSSYLLAETVLAIFRKV